MKTATEADQGSGQEGQKPNGIWIVASVIFTFMVFCYIAEGVYDNFAIIYHLFPAGIWIGGIAMAALLHKIAKDSGTKIEELLLGLFIGVSWSIIIGYVVGSLFGDND